MTYSKPIDRAIELAIEHGNSVLEMSTRWEKVRQVAHMSKPMAFALREALVGDTDLRRWVTTKTPHNSPEEGFTDDLEKVAISFPKRS